MIATLLAISEQASKLSLIGQLGSLAVAFLIGRFCLKSSPAILLVSILGAVGAMVSHIVVDGQGAFILLLFAPVIYMLAVVGRRGLE